MTGINRLTAACLMAVLATDAALGQGYTPRRPTVSPYLDLFRSDSGALPNYYTFVRPKQQIRRTQEAQNQALGRLQQGLQGVQQNQQAFTAQGVRATGTSGGYLNYLHFYPSATGR